MVFWLGQIRDNIHWWEGLLEIWLLKYHTYIFPRSYFYSRTNQYITFIPWQRVQMIKKSTYITLLIASITTIILALISLSWEEISVSFFFTTILLILGTISPYVYIAIINKVTTKKIASIILHISVTLLSVLGVYGLIQATLIEKDAQGALAFVVIPFYQWILFVVVTIPILLIQKFAKK